MGYRPRMPMLPVKCPIHVTVLHLILLIFSIGLSVYIANSKGDNTPPCFTSVSHSKII